MENNNEQDFYKGLCDTLEFIDTKLWAIVKKFQKKGADQARVLDELLKYRDKVLNSPSEEEAPIQDDLNDQVDSLFQTKPTLYIEIEGDTLPIEPIFRITKGERYCNKSSKIKYLIIINKDNREHPALLANTTYEFGNEEKRDYVYDNFKGRLSMVSEKPIIFL